VRALIASSALLCALTLLPLLWLAAAWFTPLGSAAAYWQHVFETTLAPDAFGTIVLALGVAVVAGVWGVLAAWLVVSGLAGCQISLPGQANVIVATATPPQQAAESTASASSG
jgi:ABC-type Fe3+ transport system permease subunit